MTFPVAIRKWFASLMRLLVPTLVAAVTVAACSAVPVSNPIAKTDSPPSIAPGEQWDPVLVCGKIFQQNECSIGSGVGPVFEMVVLGDSILWGQGLPEEQKASTLIQLRLAEKLDRPVHKRVYAHSGATVVQSGDHLIIKNGEVPGGFPHVALQMECVPNPEDVDLVIVNGCINDVRAEVLFDPTTGPEESGIEKLCEDKCREPIRLLLTRIEERFPRATIVVSGYYPFFSDRTPKMTLRFVSGLFLLMSKTEGKPHRWPDSGDHMIRKSAVWHEVSNKMLREAVEESNREEDTRGRIVFAPVQFLPENAYGAPESLLWGIMEHDNVASSRWWECLDRPNVPERMRCINASAFHSNPNGAIRYAEAILRALDSMTERLELQSKGPKTGD
jgi:lysophospholipase L1-like esterase